MDERKSLAPSFWEGGLYLPTLVLGYVHVATGDVVHLGLAVASLVGAVLVHGFLRSVFGPGLVERSAVDGEEFVQRVQLALYDRGELGDFPSSWRALHRAERAFPKRRLPLVALTFGSGLALLGGLGVSLYELGWLFTGGDAVAGLLGLGQVVWLLQLVLWRSWPSVHSSLDYRTGVELGIERDVGEFRRFLESDDDIRGPSLSYETSAGGAVFLRYRTDSATREEMRSEVETVAYGYAATVAQSDYPCGGVAVTLLGSDGPVGNYHIETTHANKYTDRKLPVQKYVDQILETVNLESEAEATGGEARGDQGEAAKEREEAARDQESNDEVGDTSESASSGEVPPPEPGVRSGQTNG